MGSINFGLYHLADKYETFKFDWEKPHLEATRDLVFRNSFKDIEYILATCYDNGTRFSSSATTSLISTTSRISPIVVWSSRPSSSVGVRPARRHRHPSRGRDPRSARPTGCWATALVRSARAPPGAYRRPAAAMGGNVRVGLEDSLWAGKAGS